MLTLLPILIAMALTIFKSSNDILIYGSCGLILLNLNSLTHSCECFLSILIIFFIIIWIDLNSNSLLATIFLFGSLLVLRSTSLVSLFVSIEILTLTIIIVINLYIADKYPAILYYLFSGLFSALFVLSLGYISLGYEIAYKLIYAVWIYKIGLAPFHLLLPQIYNNLSPRVILLIDIPYKALLLYMVYRLNIPLFDYVLIFSILVGSIGSIIYKNLLSIMIYSSIFNYSLLLIAIYFNNINYFLFYLIIYAFMVFIYLYLIHYKFIDRQIDHPIYLLFWFILILNLMGIPPFNGFIIKFYIFYLMAANFSYLLLFISSLGVLILSYTYLRILLSMMMSDKSFKLNHTNSTYAHIVSSLLIFISIPLFI